MLRSIPGMTVLRPADANEVAHAWAYAVKANAPVAMLLTRQNLDPLPPELAAKINIEKGAYVLSDDDDFEMILIATGSEVNTALGAAKILRAKNRKVRVVSMPSCELFIAQDKAYKDSVLPPLCKARVSIEAGITLGWERFVGDNGMSIGLDTFGASAPYAKLAELYGFTPEKVAEKIEKKF
ncbi:MAG: transketolase, partial [Victivallales bacterium]|nr:transketolase [Victivallales bacterium]